MNTTLSARVWLLGFAGAVALLCGARPVESQCPAQVILQPFQQPPELVAKKGALSTTFTVEMQKHPCVPFFDGSTWIWKPMHLRTYAFTPPGSPPGSSPTPSTPGPTLRVRKASGSQPGDALNILLVNNLPQPTVPDSQCDPACLSGSPCCPPPGQPCPSSCSKGCPQLKHPECFHGNNTTNLHFHGSHVSPQAPQDYVLLELAPADTPSELFGHTHSRGLSISGQYQYAINPFPSNQADGTHWYHPHKHGSVSVQVLNGMAGALIVEGPFDDWLNNFYASTGIKDQVMVIQQLDTDLNFFNKDPKYKAPHPLVNGRANPIVTMRPGEIQRWRLIDATMQGSAQLEIGFARPSTPTLTQIAQDGVQFAPENYQPPKPSDKTSFTLSPGNRADFLVQAPSTTGTHLLTFKVVGVLEDKLRERYDADSKAMLQDLAELAASDEGKRLFADAGKGVVAAATTAIEVFFRPLLTINVVGDPLPMTFPTQAQWPPMPNFLRDVETSEVVRDRTLVFSMDGAPGKQPNSFYINGKQFDPSCVDETMTIGTAEQWTVANSSGPKHPFHIHTNPFQIIAVNGQSLPQPWIWWDTFGLPPISTTPTDVQAGPIWNDQDAQQKCPGVCTNAKATWNGQWTTTEPGVMSVCGCLPWGSITTRSRFEDYTGEYVIHCHFLGHEDRGMMIGVQTVCPNTQSQVWGQTVSSGGADNCTITKPASPACSN